MNTKELGDMGEDIACRYLERKGFHIVGRNYRKKWGEIDVIAEKDNMLRFVEVKTVARLPAQAGEIEGQGRGYRAEENVHPRKVQRLHRAIQSYLMEHDIENDWQLDVLAIDLDVKGKRATCRFIENVV